MRGRVRLGFAALVGAAVCCSGGDARPPDGGSPGDAGPLDAGPDAGPDAGAGDAGADAGSDAGATANAVVTCPAPGTHPCAGSCCAWTVWPLATPAANFSLAVNAAGK